MNKRKFICNGIKLISIGIGYTLIPNYISIFAKDEDSDNYDIDAWEDDFQELIKKKQLHGAIQDTLKNYGPFITGKGKFQIDSKLKKTTETLHFIPELKEKFKYSIPVTPNFNLKTGTIYNTEFKGQIFNLPTINMHTGIYKGPSKKPTNEWDFDQLCDYVAYPAFSDYIGRKAYFCYGTPCEPPKIFYCKQCGEEYAIQMLYYDGNSIDDKNKIYSKGFHTFYHNLKCNDRDNIKFGQHDGLNYQTGPISTCLCEGIPGTKDELEK